MLDELVPSPELIDAVRVGRGDFRAIGESMVQRYIAAGWLKPTHTFLDIGCGLGRMARPLVPFLTSGKYIGFDINRTSIDWCKEKYAAFHRFSFHHVDAMSVVYNPEGEAEADTVRFPIEDGSVDFVHMSSVFTHMWPKDVAAYLCEVGRMLKPGGRCSVTYFLLDPLTKVRRPVLNANTLAEPLLGVKDWHPIDGGYLRDKSQPEDVVILDELMVRRFYGEAGLIVTGIAYGGWCRETRSDVFGQSDSQDAIDAVRV